jgi:Flp pilus assembly protein TadG
MLGPRGGKGSRPLARTWRCFGFVRLCQRSGSAKTVERGNTTVEALILVPIVFLLIFGAIQTAVIWHGQTVMRAAASRALRAESTRAAGVSTETAKEAVDALIAHDAKFITNAQVSVTEPGELMVVVVTGNVAGPFPGMTMHLTQRASAYSERFRPLCGTPDCAK